MANDYQTGQGDDLCYWVTMHKVAWYFDQVIINSLMKNKKRYISSSK